jgi:hypothetical protein
METLTFLQYLRAHAFDQDADTIREAYAILGDAHKHNAAQKALEFRRGQLVEFTHRSRGVIQGTVQKVNRTSLSVVAKDGGRWKVAPTLCRVIG